MIVVTQMGHSVEEGGVGTVRMGSKVVEDIGGLMCCCFSEDAVEGRCFSFGSISFRIAAGGKDGNIGGGRSMFSAAFLDNCLAKSEACHHSRNLSAKILVGSSIFSELNSLGCTLLARFLGEKMDPPSPGLAGPTFLGAVASLIAAWSAAPSLLMRVPIIQRNGEWYLDPSKRYAMLKTISEK